MDNFEYAIVFKVEKKWKARGPKINAQASLLELLNRLGSKGWEVCGTGDFGEDSRSEILIKRKKG